MFLRFFKTAIIMPAVANETFFYHPYPTVRLATLALYAGLIVGVSTHV